MNDTTEPLVTELQRMTAAGWSPDERKIIARQCLLGQAQAVAAGRPGEARRLGAIMDMLAELDAPAAAAGRDAAGDDPVVMSMGRVEHFVYLADLADLLDGDDHE